MPPVPYPPLRGTFPSRGRLAIRESPLLKRQRAALVNPSTPPLRHPERSRGIFLARPPYARMRPHSNDTLVLPFSPFSHSLLISLQERSLHFGPHDTQERRIVSYRFSYRCVELCLSEALYPAPLARPFYILMHRHRPTHCPHNPHRTRFHSFIQSRGRHAPGLTLNQFTQSKKHQP